ncbi:uncharacterized protein LOC117780483 [Drosophila innubila]|uniref:uncharacterized protein LOC117780483 n=1 Tax=Drosophila innubila TaxID=198719 RepID=UPI00148D1E05|nr:uncharacterized protein LOC117780483 [Drosophila innubila]
MAPNAPVLEAKNEPISTFAVIDLETTNLPAYCQNRVSITELCIYAFDPSILKDNHASQEPQLRGELSPKSPKVLPFPPRVLHKLNLLFQPSMAVSLDAQRITGLDNYLLERESRLNENAGQMILKFFEHLSAPICLVAHNGWHFDFPIIKQAFDKLNLKLPASMLCVDSLRAFMEIDDKRANEPFLQYVAKSDWKLEPDPELDLASSSLSIPKEIDWQTVNNTTPKRPTLSHNEAARKRKLLNDCNDEDNEDLQLCPEAKRAPQEFRSRRKLFSGLKCAQTKRFPPRGRYSLVSLFERTFELPASAAHQAEADVNMLTKLIQHYGVDFLAFAEEQAIPFSDVVPLGGKSQSSK